MTYARARLYLGIANVGFWVIVSALALLLNLPGQLFPVTETEPNEIAQRVAMMLGLYILFSLPFDIVGGYLLPRRYEKHALPFGSFLLSWLRGVLVQFVVMLLTGMLLIVAGRQSNTIGVVVFVAGVVMAALLAAQEALARASANLKVEPLVNMEEPRKVLEKWGLHMPDNVIVYSSQDQAFVGGLVGLPGLERLVLPASWFSLLNTEGVAAQIARRIGVLQNEQRAYGVFVAAIWNLVGFAIAMNVTGVGPIASVGDLMTVSLWFTLWQFLGLLLLPTVSRRGVFEADRFARKAGASQEIMEKIISESDKLQDDEPARSRLIEWIFHPIPSVENRLVELNRKRARGILGAWHAARMALYLSWACLGFMSRAVHCNIGRSDLWVMYPGD
ncbi:MAG: hypothetical protein HXY40_09665 [Chloroflexi bacterium]|nr:hypothetical protein [Chloroflexota bacterium]